jgi:hypothetical protein
MTLSKGGTPMGANSGEGSGVSEKSVIEEGQTLLMKMSISCEGAAADRIAAREV